MRILVVEDDVDARQMLQVLLQLDGHQVVTANDGLDGWKAFEDDRFPLVLTDWLMPELDGLGLCRRIRESERSSYSYIILLTALQGKAKYLEAVAAGADDFVSKPYDPEVLRSRIMVAERILSLQDRVKRLEGILSTCMYCKKIRDEQNHWVSIEHYITQRSEASFSHGVCPDCFESIVKPELERSRKS
jgi:sigma-B regulation protein RsbU (phosphoserine phosphatase)